MTCHVLHAGDGYQYLTNQVASGDVQRESGSELAAYYQQHGNPAGVWVGQGCADLEVSGEVTEEQMQALFGEGLHPDADTRIQARIDAGEQVQAAIAAERLGRRFAQFDKNVPLSKELSAAYQRFEDTNERRPTLPERRQIKERTAYAVMMAADPQRVEPTRSEVRQYLQNELGRSRQPVAGFDLVFTPVKGMSLLWGLGDHDLQATVERIHDESWREALEWVEQEGAFTRSGAGGVAQLDTSGLVATAFQHRDSRAGDPNLHTHVAVSNRVLASDGVWRTLDSRQLHRIAVTASEIYNARVEEKATRQLGVGFNEIAKGDGKRPVREVAGLPDEWLTGFSRRRAQIESSYDELVADYVREYGRTPPRTTQIALAQQATLRTRPDKTELPSLAELVGQWQQRAQQLHPDQPVSKVIAQAVGREPRGGEQTEQTDVTAVAARVVDVVSQTRTSWTGYHLRAETERQLRGVPLDSAQERDEFVERIVTRAREVDSVSLEIEPDPVPQRLQRADGSSVFRRHGMGVHTSEAVLAREDRLVVASETDRGITVASAVRETVLTQMQCRTGITLNDGQRQLVEHFTGCGRALAVGIGPPGTGKSTSMAAVRQVWETTGGRVLGLAPSAAAAEVLGDEIGTRAETLHRLTHQWRQDDEVDVRPGDMLLVDEAGMAGTAQLDTVRAIAEDRGAVLRLVGDHRQLSAPESGGALRLLHQHSGGVELSEVRRFRRADETQAVLAMRVGNESAVEFYAQNERLHGGVRAATLDELYRDWTADRAADITSLMLSDSTDVVRELSARAQTELRAAGSVEHDGVTLHDHNIAGVGDRVVTRRNRRRLMINRGRDFVKNGDLWRVLACDAAGRLQVQHIQHQGTRWLPANYVASHVELGYATTVHRAQGMTVDRSRMHLSEAATREAATVGLSRGREENHAYLETDSTLDADEPEVMTGDLYYGYRTRSSVADAFAEVLRREGADVSATEQLREEQTAPFRLDHLVPQYDYARHLYRGQSTAAEAEHWVRIAVPDWAATILTDKAWPALQTVLHDVRDTGIDPIPLLRDRASESELGTASSVAQVLHHRIAEHMPNPVATPHRPAQLPGWVATPPQPEDGTDRPQLDQELGTWLVNRAERISDRVVWLGEQAGQHRPPWTDELGELPTDPYARAIWQLRAGQVAAFRERFEIPDSDRSLLGPTGQGRLQRARDWVQRYLALDDPHTLQYPQPQVDAGTAAAINRVEHEAVQPETAEEVLAAARSWAAGQDTPESPAQLSGRIPAPGEDEQVDRTAEINAVAAAWFGQQLDAHPHARDYVHSRVPDTDAARARFTVGYAPAGWHGLVQHLRGQGYTDGELVDAGVASESRNGWALDRFRDRAMLAWHDEHGRVAGFTGRDLSEQHPAKYLNTPATRLFDKSELVFGLHEQRTELDHGATPILVEGPFDVLALRSADPHRADIAPVTASGTAITDRHLDTLARTAEADRLVVGLDQDEAGQAATASAVQRAVTRWPDTRVAALPDGNDPADWVAAHADDPQQALAAYTDERQQEPAAEWLAHRAIDQHFAARPQQETEVEGRLAAANAATQAVAHVDLARASHVGLDVAQRLQIEPQHVATMLANARTTTAAADTSRPPNLSEEAADTPQRDTDSLVARARALRQQAADRQQPQNSTTARNPGTRRGPGNAGPTRDDEQRQQQAEARRQRELQRQREAVQQAENHPDRGIER